MIHISLSIVSWTQMKCDQIFMGPLRSSFHRRNIGIYILNFLSFVSNCFELEQLSLLQSSSSKDLILLLLSNLPHSLDWSGMSMTSMLIQPLRLLKTTVQPNLLFDLKWLQIAVFVFATPLSFAYKCFSFWVIQGSGWRHVEFGYFSHLRQ